MFLALSQGPVMGNITIFLVIFPQVFNVLQNIASGISTVYQNNVFVVSIFELFDLRANVPPEGETRPIPDDLTAAIELKNVNFTYEGTDTQVLKDINLKIPAGKIVAVVGLNGAGKTTLIKLLCRLYDPTSGTITLGNEDIHNFRKMIIVNS